MKAQKGAGQKELPREKKRFFPAGKTEPAGKIGGKDYLKRRGGGLTKGHRHDPGIPGSWGQEAKTLHKATKEKALTPQTPTILKIGGRRWVNHEREGENLKYLMKKGVEKASIQRIALKK